MHPLGQGQALAFVESSGRVHGLRHDWLVGVSCTRAAMRIKQEPPRLNACALGFGKCATEGPRRKVEQEADWSTLEGSLHPLPGRAEV